jgi:signal transduction histidine kinase/CheY-like chemotaxis protein
MRDAGKTSQQLLRELEELRSREGKFRDFFVNAPVQRFLLLDADLNIVAGNEVVLDLFSGFFGVKKEDLIGASFPDLIPGFQGSDRHAKYLEVLRTGIPFHTEELAPPPQAGDVRISVSVFKAGEGLGIIATDITEQSRMAEALKKSEERYRTFFDEAPTALWEIDGSYIKETCDRLRGTGVTDFKAYFETHPEDAIRCTRRVRLVEMNRASLELFEAASKEEVFENLYRLVPRDASPTFSPGIVAVAEGRASFQRQVSSATLRGRKKHFLYRWSVLPGFENTYARVLLSLVDVTDRVLLEQELLRTQKLESLGVLAGGIAHDFNNFLTAISTNLAMALMYGKLDDDTSSMLGEAERATHRARSLTQQLLSFAKGGKPVKKMLSMRGLLFDTAEFSLSGSRARSVCIVPEGLWDVSADEGQIQQVIQNLVINADQAMPEGGEVRVSAENVLVGPAEQIPLKEGRYVKVSVADQGIGISSKHLDRVFDPFFTTKQKGSGLGLTTCFTIVKNHEGHIRVRSEVDRGTTVEVFLPASGGTVRAREPGGARPLGGEGRVLLIDDEEMIRRSAGEMLRRFGYEVTLAADGEEGIRRYREAGARGLPFHAVIVDLTIRGGTGGKEALEELLSIDPDAKVLVSSGYSDDPVMADFEAHGFRGVIRKPYKLEEVGETLRRVIAGATGPG